MCIRPSVILSELTLQVPHPLFAKFELRIQTDGQITPKEALTAACSDTNTELEILKRRFREAYAFTKTAQVPQNGA